MKLELFSGDLKPEHRDCQAWETKFEMFSEEAKKAILLIGRALYWHRDQYNAIDPPKDTPKMEEMDIRPN